MQILGNIDNPALRSCNILDRRRNQPHNQRRGAELLLATFTRGFKDEVGYDPTRLCVALRYVEGLIRREG
jgi:hypothetical protein